MIALRKDGEILGFLQLNDTRKGQFTPEKLKFWERLSGYLTYFLLIARVEEFLLEAYETHLMQSETLEVQANELRKAANELRKANEDLQRSEEQYRNIVETANEGIMVIESGHSITYVNEKMAEMLGYRREEVIGKSVRDFTDEGGKATFEKIMKMRRQGNTESHEFRFITKAGFPLWTHVNSKPLFDSNGEFLGSLSMLTDITKRKEAEQALENFKTAREKEIYHRIKNNLLVVSSLLDLQVYMFKGRSDINDSEVMKVFRESQNRVMSMTFIHEELYKGGRLETINFSEYVEKLSDSLLSAYRIGNINIRLIKDPDENLLFSTDTAIPLGTIINELVTNSFKYAFPGRNEGEIRILLRREEQDFIKPREKSESEDSMSTNLLLSVSDNGIGIPKNLDIEDLDSLGLQLVTTLVEQLDGKLKLSQSGLRIS